jgi:flagella basal body P-ring formation protein FlgA
MLKFSVTAILFMTTCYCAYSANTDQVKLNFRDTVMINDTLITLGDVAEISCSDFHQRELLDNFVIGDAAPAGYSRFIGIDNLITFQLRPKINSKELISAGSKRTLVITNYKELSIDQVRDSIDRFFNTELSWQKGSWELDVLNENEKFKIRDKPYDIEFSGLISNSPRGRFSVQMAVVQGSKVTRVSVRCAIKVSAPVVVAIRPILRGEIVGNHDCEIRVIDITTYGIVPCNELSEVVGKKAMRQILTGSVLTKQWICQIPDIEKGDPVKLESGKNLVRVAVSAVARESGSIGDKIWVENKESHKMIKVLVKKKGCVTTL